jgi:eukaryotic-like serine/threonine-protein kinase
MPTKAQDDDVVMNLVDLALARPPEEREAYVQSVCGEDTELLTEVWNYVRWEQRMNGFLLDPLFPAPSSEHPLEPGELLADRFRIVREVAQGGMGIVYEATDEKLERRVALKCGKTGFRKRLPPEVRSATAISHPNVCKTYEIHTANTSQGEIDFLTMEFLDGETLTERLRRGPLPEPEARAIALQLCAGLAEAHRNQVVHGDLKSGNVILTTGPEGAVRAVITDFGLARKPDTGQSALQSGPLCGTPDYMAPELWKGERASAASDVYALGVILYELVSGGRPYPSQMPWQERLTAHPPAVNPKWDGVLARCLDPDPSTRFKDAQEVARALAPSKSRRRFLTAAAAALLAAIATGIVVYRSAVPHDSVRLAMLPFTTDASTAALGDGLNRDIADQLTRLKGNARISLTVIPESRIQRDRVDTIEKARDLLGATQVLRGALTRENEKLVLHAYLADVRSRVNTREWKIEYAPKEIRYMPVALAGMVTGTLQLPALVTGAVVNAAARQDYLNGLAAVRRDTGVDSALEAFQRAVAADPDSPLTYAGLAEAQWFKYFLTKDDNWLQRSKESARQAELRNPDLAPVLRIAGILDANSGLYELAEAEYRRGIELEPANGDGYRRLGQVLEQNNQLEDALAQYRKALDADPGYYRTYQAIGTYYLNRGNYDEAANYLRRTVELAPDEPNAHYALGVTYMNLGRFTDAEHEVRASLNLAETPATLHLLAHIIMYQGRDGDAIPYIYKALDHGAERYLEWLNLGIAYRRLNLKAKSDEANQRALAIAEHQMPLDPRNGKIRAGLAYLCARLGERSRAESEVAQALQLSPGDADTRWMAAVTYEALGRRERTLEVLNASPSAVLADLSRWPDVADLRADGRFQQLLASHQLK